MSKQKIKRRAQLRNRNRSVAVAVVTERRLFSAPDSDLASNVRRAADLYNAALDQAKSAGLTVIERLDTPTEAGGTTGFHAEPINITAVHRAY